MKTSLGQSNIKKTFIKRDINEDSIKYFKFILNSVDCDLKSEILTTDGSYNKFLDKFVKIYDIAFPERKIQMKQKNCQVLGLQKDW